ncbi:hypothetical protein AB0I02_38725 [Streptomyces phaeochromogenes]
MKLLKRLSAATSVVALTGTAILTNASTADAAAWNCPYPYACLYDRGTTKLEQYRQVTSGWQPFSRTDVAHAVNSRNDDVVFIRHTSGLVACLPSGHPERVYMLYGHIPNGIRIDSSPSCGSTLVPEYYVP